MSTSAFTKAIEPEKKHKTQQKRGTPKSSEWFLRGNFAIILLRKNTASIQKGQFVNTISNLIVILGNLWYCKEKKESPLSGHLRATKCLSNKQKIYIYKLVLSKGKWKKLVKSNLFRFNPERKLIINYWNWWECIKRWKIYLDCTLQRYSLSSIKRNFPPINHRWNWKYF